MPQPLFLRKGALPEGRDYRLGDPREGGGSSTRSGRKRVGPKKGQHSIRISDKWRICFEWPDGSPGPLNVEIVDYH